MQNLHQQKPQENPMSSSLINHFQTHSIGKAQKESLKISVMKEQQTKLFATTSVESKTSSSSPSKHHHTNGSPSFRRISEPLPPTNNYNHDCLTPTISTTPHHNNIFHHRSLSSSERSNKSNSGNSINLRQHGTRWMFNQQQQPHSIQPNNHLESTINSSNLTNFTAATTFNASSLLNPPHSLSEKDQYCVQLTQISDGDENLLNFQTSAPIKNVHHNNTPTPTNQKNESPLMGEKDFFSSRQEQQREGNHHQYSKNSNTAATITNQSLLKFVNNSLSESLSRYNNIMANNSLLESSTSKSQHIYEQNSNNNNLENSDIEDFSILITNCLQNDFIGKFPEQVGTNYSGSLDFDSSTFMHVGKPESQRLLGSDYKSGPLKNFMNWARRQSSAHLEIIHVRFWNEIDHLVCKKTDSTSEDDSPDKYICNGLFSVKGTSGANLVLNLDKDVPNRENESYVNITSVNAFFNTDLEEKIQNAIQKKQKQLDQENLTNGTQKKLNVKIGAIGVWTESTIQYLFYELFTRYRRFAQILGTCSALTASRSRHQHFASLQQLERYFSVSIFYSLCDFQEWLIPFWWKKTPSSSIVSSGAFFFKQISPSPTSTSFDLSIPSSDNDMELDDANESIEEHRIIPCIHWKTLGDDINKISDVDKEIICLLYHDSTDVMFTPLSGGYSGSWVFKVNSKDSMGHVQATSILKIGRRGPITRERVNFEKVEEILGNNAPQIRGFTELKDRAGIKFAYASMFEDDFQYSSDSDLLSPKSPLSPFASKKQPKTPSAGSFRELYISGGSMQTIKSVLHRVFYGVLGRFYDAAVLEQIDLFETYDFNGKGWAWHTGGTDNPDAVRDRTLKMFAELRDCSFFEPRQVPKLTQDNSPPVSDVEEISTPISATSTSNGTNVFTNSSSSTVTMPTIHGEEKYLIFPGGFRVRNIVHFLRDSIPKIKQGYLAKSFHYVSFVHGDLNGRNVILDSNENVWLIDFEYTERTHILKDVVKFETDVLFEYTVLENEKELEEALLITKELVSVKDLAEPLPPTLPGLKSEKLKRAWETVAELRSITKRLVRGDRNPVQLDIVLLRYTLHMATLNSLTLYQRAWALATACALAQKIERKAFRNDKYHIDWINLKMLDQQVAEKREINNTQNSENGATPKKKKYGRLGISIIPGRPSHGGVMVNDLKVLQKNNVKKLVVLSTQDELEHLSGNLLREATNLGIETRMLPVQQRHPPPMNYTLLLCEWIKEALDKKGEDVVIVVCFIFALNFYKQFLECFWFGKIRYSC